MTEKKKITKKVWAATLGGAALFALIVILATCSLFDSKANDSVATDWNTIVKNSTWTFNKMNVSDSGKMILALQKVKKVYFSEDLDVTVEYCDDSGTSYYFSTGKIKLDSGKSRANLSVTMAGETGYITNSLIFSFSNQEKKQFDSHDYVLSIVVKDVGTLWFFKD